MGKVLKYEEINRRKNEHVMYSESYVVEFNIKDGEYWTRKQEVYFTKNKGDAESVYKRWKNDFIGKQIEYISISYQ